MISMTVNFLLSKPNFVSLLPTLRLSALITVPLYKPVATVSSEGNSKN
jgi:hypothetical protein